MAQGKKERLQGQAWAQLALGGWRLGLPPGSGLWGKVTGRWRWPGRAVRGIAVQASIAQVPPLNAEMLLFLDPGCWASARGGDARHGSRP